MSSPLLAPRRNFGDVPTDHYVFHFMRYMLKHVNTKWRGAAIPELTLEDMVSIAAEALADYASTFPQWALEHGLSPFSGGLFWSGARTHIDHKILKAVDDARKRQAAGISYVPGTFVEAGEVEPLFDGDPRTQLMNYTPPSILLPQLVLSLQHLSERALVILSLYHFDELTAKEISALTETPETTMQRHMKAAADTLRDRALALTLDEFEEPPPPRSTTEVEHSEALLNWVHDRYGATPDKYVAYVLAHFKADVSYVVDILEFANGRIIKHRAHQRINTEVCSIDACERPACTKGLCSAHYKSRPEAPRCTLEHCERPRKAWGLCSLHYGQEKRRRDVAEVLR